MSKAPVTIMVVSILAIIYSAFSILGAPCTAFITFHPLTPSPMMDNLVQDKVYIALTFTMLIINFMLGIALLIISIASLKLRPWARKAMNTYCTLHFAFLFVGTLIAIFVTVPKMSAAMAAAPAGPLGSSAMVTIAIASAIMGFLFHGAILTTILIFFNRKIAIDAFNGILPASPSSFPVDYTQDPNNPQPPAAPQQYP